MAKKTIADNLRQAVKQAELRGITRYRIHCETGIAQSVLSRFASGAGYLRIEQAELVARSIGYKLSLTRHDK